MSWFEDYVPKYEPSYAISEPVLRMENGYLEQLDEQELYEVDIEVETKEPSELDLITSIMEEVGGRTYSLKQLPR